MASKPLIAIWSYADNDWFVFANGSNIRTPSSYKGYSTTVVDSARNSKAQMVGEVVAEDVAKIEVKWNFLTISEFANLSQLFLKKYGGEFVVPVVFFDETLGSWDGDITQPPSVSNNVRMFYPNDRVADVAQLALDEITGMPKGYVNVSLHLIDTVKRFVE